MISMKQFIILFGLAVSLYGAEKFVNVDAASDLGPFRLKIGTNAGPLAIESGENLTPLFRSFGIQAIRTHDYYGPCDWCTIFPDWTADPENPASYDFASSDSIIQSIVEGGFDILYRLGPSWHDLACEYHDDPPGTIRDEFGIVTHIADTSDFIKFANVCRHIVMHYNNGWAHGFNYGIKKWEIWNEPSLEDHFWTGTPQQFFTMFATVIKTLKAYDPNLIIGGPGLAGGAKDAYKQPLIEYCVQSQTPLDFYTWHSYGSGFVDDVSPWNIARRAKEVRSWLENAGFTNTQSICDEWNASLNVNYFGDSARGAAFYACALSYMVNEGLNECYQYRADDHALGLIKSNGELRKAAFSLLAWQQLILQTHRLDATGTDTSGFTIMASKSNVGDKLYLLLANFKEDSQIVNLTINNMPTQNSSGWLLEKYIINSSLDLERIETLPFCIETVISHPFSIQAESVCLIKCIPEVEVSVSTPPLPKTELLLKNYPNPFNPKTTIRYTIPKASRVNLRVFNVQGRQVNVLVNQYQSSGNHAVSFDGSSLPSGEYFYKLETERNTQIKKMLLIK